MSTQAIRTLLLSQIDFPIVSAKNKLREEGKKRIENLKSKLPTLDELKEQFISDNCELGAQEKLQKTFDNIKDKIDKIMSAIDAALKLLNKLKEKLQKILNKIIPKIQKILNTLDPIIRILDIILKVIPRMSMFIPTTIPGITAGMILMLEDAIKIAKGIVGEFKALIAAMKFAFNIYISKVNALLEPLDKATNGLTAFKEMVKQRLGVLDMLILQYLTKCNVGIQRAIDGSTGDVNADLLNPDLATLTEMYGHLIDGLTDGRGDGTGDGRGDGTDGLSGQKVIERVKNIKFGFQTSYRVIDT